MSGLSDLFGKHIDPERAAAQEILDEFRHLMATSTQMMERLGGQLINGVLQVETVIIPTSGAFTRDFGVPIGSIDVSNQSQDAVTVQSGGARASAPTSGVGVFIVASGSDKLINLATTTVTIYGTAGDKICYQAFTAGGVSGNSLNAINGGAA